MAEYLFYRPCERPEQKHFSKKCSVHGGSEQLIKWGFYREADRL